MLATFVCETAGRADRAEQGLTAEKQISRNALARVDQLNAQLARCASVSRIAAALDVSEAKVKEQQGQIVELGKRLNLALVNKVEELAHYRSEFSAGCARFSGPLGYSRRGDRFVFQSEVLFAPGSADLTDEAKRNSLR
jgi:chemotaxis protein MotB